LRLEGLFFSVGFGPSGWLILGGDFAVLQAPVFEDLSFDALPFFEDLAASTEVDIRRGQIIQALVIAIVIIVLDAVADLGFRIAVKIVCAAPSSRP
jgi:hypothetical protein